MSIAYNSTDGMIISPTNQSDTITITCKKTDGSVVNSVILSSNDVTFNVPIKISSTIPIANMVGYTQVFTLPANISITANSSAVVNLATISGLPVGTYLFKGEILMYSSATQSGKKRTRLAMQFNDVGTSSIDTTGKYGGYDDTSTIVYVNITSANRFSNNVQSILNVTGGTVYFNIIFNTNITSCTIISGSGNSSYTVTRIA